MPAINFNLDNISTTGLFAVEQGATLDWLTFFHSEDLSAYTPKGEIRTNYLDETDSEVLATFTFDALTFGQVTLADNSQVNRTIIRPKLTAESTGNIPITLPTNNKMFYTPGVNCHVYDIKLVSPTNEVIIIARGFVQVIPHTTEC